MKVVYTIDPAHRHKPCVVWLTGNWGWWTNRRPPKRRG